jgi:hypothetical protein
MIFMPARLVFTKLSC